jgi:hypothetical protein
MNNIVNKKRKKTDINLFNLKKPKQKSQIQNQIQNQNKIQIQNQNKIQNKRKFKDIIILNSKKNKLNNYCCIHEDKTICNMYECIGISNRSKLYISMPYII